MTKRKPVAVATIPGILGESPPSLVAAFDDGSMWVLALWWRDKFGRPLHAPDITAVGLEPEALHWERLPSPPPEDENTP